MINQEEGERNAQMLVDGLSLISSPECSEAVTPFLCLYIFTLCDSDNRLHTILRGDCLELRDTVCVDEWSQAVGILGTGVLPVCEELLEIEDECVGKCKLL